MTIIRKSPTANPSAPFAGFASPNSNTLYCPNQFFDVCLRHRSRGCIRVVALLLRQTLGWSDREGRPLRDRHAISYSEFEQAGIGKDTVVSALNEAIKGNFIRCVAAPSAAAMGKPPSKGLYELNWDESGEYVKDPSLFRGFFAGEGNRTYIPNAYFDHLIAHETLSVIKVVGAIIRFSIGFQTKWGHRRQQVAMSYRDIERYARIGSPASLSKALTFALHHNYLVRVSEGYFDRDGGKLSAKACYALRWLNQVEDSSSSRNSVAAESSVTGHPEKWSGTSRKCVAAKRSDKCSHIETTGGNNIIKQHGVLRKIERSKERAANAGLSSDIAVVFEELRRTGFDAAAAQHLASHYPAHVIVHQIELVGRRSSSRNRLGLLRRAIEENWAAPMSGSRSPDFGRPKSRSPDEADRHGTGSVSSVAELLARHLSPRLGISARTRIDTPPRNAFKASYSSNQTQSP